MKTVRIYYSGIPKKNSKSEKRDVLEYFHMGVQDGQSVEVEDPIWQPSDLAVIQGWIRECDQKASHLRFRKTVIDNQKRIGKHTLAVDSNLFLYRDPGNTKKYLRFSMDGIFPTTGCYFDKEIQPERWDQIRKDLHIELKPWTLKGKHILLCLQRNGGWSMGDYNVMDWCHNTIEEIRKYSDRIIKVRPHPGDKKAKEYLKLDLPGVKISEGVSILEDFRKAWATVTYNSSPGVASAIEGIPVFVTDPDYKKSQAADVCNISLSQLENPLRPDREEWIQKISMSHFNFEDLKTGKAWNIIKNYL